MKVLQLCPKPPLPAIDGGCLASYELSRLIQGTGSELQVISLSTEKHPYLREEMDDEFVQNTNFMSFDIKTGITPFGLFSNLFHKKSFHEDRFYKKQFSLFLRQHLKNHDYDIIILDGLMTCLYMEDIKQSSAAKIVYRSHNIEYSLLEQRSENEGNFIKKIYLNIQANRLRRFEEKTWFTTDEIWSISSADSDQIKSATGDQRKVKIVSFSMDSIEETSNKKTNTLFHLGAMDWKPNADGIFWFVNEVWPKVRKEIAEAELHLGGKDIENMVNQLKGDGIVIHEKVQNAEDFYSNYNIMIVPIHSGSGLRIKIVQALAAGKAILSTATGMIGIPGNVGEDYIVSNDGNQMSTDIINLLRDEAKQLSLSKNARNLFMSNFETSIVRDSLKELLSN